MNAEEKDLLLNDLNGRLRYGVKFPMMLWDEETGESIRPVTLYSVSQDGYCRVLEDDYMPYIDEIKPYLFPLSSMTEKQKEEYYYIVNYISPDDTENLVEGEFVYVNQINQLLHFYHMNHLDYRGLIPQDLAIDATGKNVY